MIIWPGGQAVKTPPFHGGDTGSIPVRVTIVDFMNYIRLIFSFLLFYELLFYALR